MRFLLDVAEIDKVVMFSWHREVMDQLYEALNEKYGVVEVRGGLSQLRKDKSVEEFVCSHGVSNKRVFSGQLLASGVGIDGLQGVCSHAVVTEPDWVPGNNLQAIDRIHRIGQHDNVIAHKLCESIETLGEFIKTLKNALREIRKTRFESFNPFIQTF